MMMMMIDVETGESDAERGSRLDAYRSDPAFCDEFDLVLENIQGTEKDSEEEGVNTCMCLFM